MWQKGKLTSGLAGRGCVVVGQTLRVVGGLGRDLANNLVRGHAWSREIELMLPL